MVLIREIGGCDWARREDEVCCLRSCSREYVGSERVCEKMEELRDSRRARYSSPICATLERFSSARALRGRGMLPLSSWPMEKMGVFARRLGEPIDTGDEGPSLMDARRSASLMARWESSGMILAGESGSGISSSGLGCGCGCCVLGYRLGRGGEIRGGDRGGEFHRYSDHSGSLTPGVTVTGGRTGGDAVMGLLISAVVMWCFEDLLLLCVSDTTLLGTSPPFCFDTDF